MTDYQKYINALRKCDKEHENDRTFTGHIIVADLCRDTANLLEELEQEPIDYKTQYENYLMKSEVAISQLRADRDRLQDAFDKIRAEVENINVWGMRYNPDTDKDRKPQIVQKVKEHVIEILDKYKSESEG